jgi:hypothetical protein
VLAADARAEPAAAGTGPLTLAVSGLGMVLSCAGAGGSGADLQAATSDATAAMSPASSQGLRWLEERSVGVGGMMAFVN